MILVEFKYLLSHVMQLRYLLSHVIQLQPLLSNVIWLQLITFVESYDDVMVRKLVSSVVDRGFTPQSAWS